MLPGSLAPTLALPHPPFGALSATCSKPCCQALSHPPSRCRIHHSAHFLQRAQNRVARLSRTHPRVAASTIRRTFCSTAVSRGDPSARIRYSSDPHRALSQHVDNWRTHFSSVGSCGSTLDEAFFRSVLTRFVEVVSSPIIPTPFSSSELRHALTQCADSAGLGWHSMFFQGQLSLLKRGHPMSPTTVGASLLLRVSSSCSSTWCTRISPHIFPQLNE